MENIQYSVVEQEDRENHHKEDGKFYWKYFLRQAYVCSVLAATYLLMGMAYGAPTVFVPQMRRESNATISDSTNSLLVTIFDYAGLPWVIILPLSASYFGRKYTLAFTCIMVLISSIVFYFSKNVNYIIVSDALMAVNLAANTTIAMMIAGEYTSPQYRGFFITFKSATFFWGIWISNAIGTFFHWKNIPLVMIAVSGYATIAAFFIPESPNFLAKKSKAECIKWHRWLKGSSEKLEKELQNMLYCHDTSLKRPKLIASLLDKRFYKATLLCMCLFASYFFTGKLACTVFAIDIMKRITSSEAAAYEGMLILDGVTVFSMYLGTIMARFFKRKVLYMSTTSVGIFFLLSLSLYLYLVKLGVLTESNIVSLTLLCMFSIALGFGPTILSASLLSEILPLQYRSVSVVTAVIFKNVITSTIFTLTPIISRKFGLHVIFLCFGVSSAFILLIWYFYMPETKDKTLLEISDEIVGEKDNHI